MAGGHVKLDRAEWSDNTQNKLFAKWYFITDESKL